MIEKLDDGRIVGAYGNGWGHTVDARYKKVGNLAHVTPRVKAKRILNLIKKHRETRWVIADPKNARYWFPTAIMTGVRTNGKPHNPFKRCM